MYQRTYFSKDNLLIKNSEINLGKNSLAKIYYNNDNCSRYIFNFNLDYIKHLYDNCYLGNLSKVNHKLVFRKSNIINNTCKDDNYKICLYKLNQQWDEGCGNTNLNLQKKKYVEQPSNWFKPNFNNIWEEEGSYLSGNTVECVDINCSNCDTIEFEITEEINNIISGNTINYGYGLAFYNDINNNFINGYQDIEIYTKDTTTFFQPYLETEYIKDILSDKNKFFIQKNNKLYLNTNGISLDLNPQINLYNDYDEVIFSGDTMCVSNGLYETNVYLSNDVCINEYIKYKWTNLYFNNINLNDIEDEIKLQNYNEFFEEKKNVNYILKLNGLNDNIIINDNNIYKINCNFYILNFINKKYIPDNVFYKIYIKEGCCIEHIITNWSFVNYTNCNYWFYLDTSWMLNQEYHVDIKVIDNNEEKVFKNVKSFKIRKNNIC